MPRSIQRPHPPILIAGGGPKLLCFAGREADIIGVDPRSRPEGGQVPGDITESIVDQKIDWIREGAGERWPELEINHVVFDLDPAYRPGSGRTTIVSDMLSLEEIVRSPYYLLGEPERMADKLHASRERWGFSYLVVDERNMGAFAPVVGRLAGG